MDVSNEYHVADNFCGMLILIIFMVNFVIMKIFTHACISTSVSDFREGYGQHSAAKC